MSEPRGAKPEIFVHSGGDLLANAAAARIITRVADAQAATGHAHLVLTGGGIGTKVLAGLAAAPARDAVNWRAVDFWWGDERFLPAGHPDRNETGARAALLDKIDADPARIHPMPGPDGPDGDDPEAAARRYAAELKAAARPGDPGEVLYLPGQPAPTDLPRLPGQPAPTYLPVFDILMLGIGPEGHVASLFPEMPQIRDTSPVVAVRDSPKPPPVRISLTFGPIQGAHEVWILASGAEKADAVAGAAEGTDPARLPAAGARGAERTLFLLDEAAAGKLPARSS